MMHIAGRQYTVWLILAWIAALLAICAWPIMAFSSVFAFDSPTATQYAGTYVLVGFLVFYPIIPIAGVLGSFFAYRGQRRGLAYGLAAIAVLPAVIMLVGLIVSQVYSLVLLMSPSTLRTTVP